MPLKSSADLFYPALCILWIDGFEAKVYAGWVGIARGPGCGNGAVVPGSTAPAAKPKVKVSGVRRAAVVERGGGRGWEKGSHLVTWYPSMWRCLDLFPKMCRDSFNFE